jgi:hypothetical protein
MADLGRGATTVRRAGRGRGGGGGARGGGRGGGGGGARPPRGAPPAGAGGAPPAPRGARRGAEAPGRAANVGDSTVWLQRGDHIEELSVSDRWSNGGVLQCLGANDDGVVPHVRSLDLGPGDRLLVATDGLTDVLPSDLLHHVLTGDARRGAERLLELVEQAGVPDDLTFLVADLRDGGATA